MNDPTLIASSAPASTLGRDNRAGSPLLVSALAFAVLTLAGAMLGGRGPLPGASAAEVLAYASGESTLITLGAAVLFASALPLVVYAATVAHLIRGAGSGGPGPTIGLVGAVLAGSALTISALSIWTSTQIADLGDPVLAKALSTLWFAFGGIGFVVPFGLLLAGIAVPALLGRLLPRPLAWFGIVVAALAVLSVLGLALPALYPLLPVGRFGGLIFLLATAALLPSRARSRA